MLSIIIIAATVGFDPLYYGVREGDGNVEVCLRMIDLPDGGLECDVTAYLNTNDFSKTSTYIIMYQHSRADRPKSVNKLFIELMIY